MASMSSPRRISPAPAWIAAGLLALAAMLLFAATPARAAAAKGACPSTFRVLNNDTIGPLKLAKGSYAVTVGSPALSCSHAFDLFRQFLEDYDGKLSDGWHVRARTSGFLQPSSGDSFTVKRARRGGGGNGGGGGHTQPGTSCPDLFTVQHDDRIGRLSVPQGQYRLTLLAVNRLSCARASKLFAKFLDDYSGKLQDKWQLDVETGTFYKNLHTGFRIKRTR
jgi:hypothetical protein